MTALVSLGWMALGGCALWSRRPLPAGAADRLAAPRIDPGRTTVARAGGVVIGVLARASGRQDLHRRLDPVRLGRCLLGAAVAGVVLPLAAPGVVAVLWGAPALRQRRIRLGRADDLQRQLPEAVDLLALAISAGATVANAIEAVAHRAGGPIGAALDEILRAASGGRRLADVLAERAGLLGDGARPLVAALVAALRDGVPIGASLERLAAELRQDRRRRAEQAARKVPVKLLFPLVACILPAFALLTVAPLLAGALDALRP